MAALRTSSMKGQSGAALVEFVVVSVVLVPIMFGIPMIGKMIDLKQTTVQASRYGAWETTVSPTGAPPTNLDLRFFSDASVPISSTDVGPNKLWGPANTMSTSEEGDAPIGPLGGYHADTAVIVSQGATAKNPSAYDPGVNADGTQYAPGANKSVAYVVGKAVDVLGSISSVSGGKWGESDGMRTDGLIRGEASVVMEGNGWLEPLTITQGTVIMNDSWNVGDAGAARDRVRSLVPAGALKPAGKFLGYMGKVPGMRELKYFGRDNGRGVFGYVDMEPLPPSENVGPRPLKEYVE